MCAYSLSGRDTLRENPPVSGAMVLDIWPIGKLSDKAIVLQGLHAWGFDGVGYRDETWQNRAGPLDLA